MIFNTNPEKNMSIQYSELLLDLCWWIFENVRF